MTPKTDYERIAKVYDEGRSIPLDQLDEWRIVLARYVTSSHRLLLDLGSGTGLFAEALAAWFNVGIVGVEPSDAMRRHAVGKRSSPDIIYLGGSAERIPLRTGICDSAWLSTVIHHIPDLPACAGELRRVLKRGSPILIRNSFGDRLEDIHWLAFFPAAKRLAAERWPTVGKTVQAFATAGFRVERLESVPEVITGDMHAYCERIRVRANSTLNLISDEDFEEGMSRLEKAATEPNPPQPVVDHRDLLVLR